MGMRSTLNYDDTQVKDLKEFQEAIVMFNATKSHDSELPILKDNNGEIDIDFSVWDDYKLSGYWYEDTIEVLKFLSKWIKGHVEFNCDGEYNWELSFDGEGNIEYREDERIWGNFTPFIDNDNFTFE